MVMIIPIVVQQLIVLPAVVLVDIVKLPQLMAPVEVFPILVMKQERKQERFIIVQVEHVLVQVIPLVVQEPQLEQLAELPSEPVMWQKLVRVEFVQQMIFNQLHIIRVAPVKNVQALQLLQFFKLIMKTVGTNVLLVPMGQPLLAGLQTAEALAPLAVILLPAQLVALQPAFVMWQKLVTVLRPLARVIVIKRIIPVVEPVNTVKVEVALM